MASRAPMEMLREKAQEKLDDATQHLGKTRLTYEKAHAQLRQLESYQQEYQYQLNARAKETGLPVSHIISYQSFIESLGHVLTQYSEHVASCKNSVNQAVCEWQDDHLRLNAFKTLITRAEDIARVKESRHEQKLMDEFASQTVSRKKAR